MKLNRKDFLRVLRKGIVMAALGVMFVSCDEIPQDKRFSELPQVKPQRAVLLEDFTGQACINCPKAHDVIKSLQEQYGHNVIPVAIHSGSLSWSETMEGVVGLATKDGNTMANELGVKTFPSGCVNMATKPLKLEEWAVNVRTFMELPASIQMTVEAGYDAVEKLVKIKVGGASTQGFTGTLHMWILESGIVAPQFMPDGKLNPEYVHDHVFRAAVGSLQGSDVTLPKQAIVEGKEIPYTTFTATCAPAAKWNLSNLSVVAFFKDASGVVNAAECKVTVN